MQLQKALETDQSEKTGKWKKVFSGIRTGDLQIGSRTPIKNIPNWVTPEVIRGGFATGEFKAGGPLKPHETELAKELAITDKSASRVREQLNRWYLTETGFESLGQMIETGNYRADAPEEFALLAVCALSRDHGGEAKKILSDIEPFFDRLRFYPRPANSPQQEGFFRQSIYQLSKRLTEVQCRPSIKVQSKVLNQWLPIYDNLLDLLEDREQEYWNSKAKTLLTQADALLTNGAPRRWSDPKRPFQRCLGILRRVVMQQPLAETDTNYLQLVLNRHAEKYGDKKSKNQFRTEQKKQDVKYWHDELAQEFRKKIEHMDPEAGLREPEELLRSSKVVPPYSIAKKLQMSRMDSLEKLIEHGQINSQEVLARFVPKISAKVVSSGIKHPKYRELYENLYRSFHDRRSLLLLNLESQTRLEELPWASAFDNLEMNTTNISKASVARMTEMASLILTHFPQSQLPNPMIEQFTELKRTTDLKTPFVPELAADIFMGKFSKNFGAAAVASNRFLKDTVYGRYYNLPKTIDPTRLGAMCAKRAKFKRRQGGSWVAQNGTVIEQAMILTSHNMANLLENLELDVDYSSSTLLCFEFVVKNLGAQPSSRYLELIALKNSAYAWRQMLTLLSQLNRAEQEKAFEKIKKRLQEQPQEFQDFFEPIFVGLIALFIWCLFWIISLQIQI